MYPWQPAWCCSNGAAARKERIMDETDFTILHSLQENARIPVAELSRKTGLSARAVGERMKRLEEEGVISGYHAVLNPAKIGYPLRAYVCITAKREMFTKIINYARETPEVREAHHVNEPHSFILRLL